MTRLGILMIAVWLSLIATAVAQSAERAPAVDASNTAGIWALAIGQIVGLLMFWLKSVHDERTKRDERAAAVAAEQQRIDAAAAAEQQRIDSETDKELRHRRWLVEDRARQVLFEKIQENTDISRNAFAASNHVNERFHETQDGIADTQAKLKHLTEMFDAVNLDARDAATASDRRLDRLEGDTP
jgi:hypothetical protein